MKSKKSNRIIQFFKEFKRRKVGRVLIAYAGIAAIIIGIIPIIEEELNLPPTTSTIILILLIIGLPIAGVLTWGYQMKSKEEKLPEKKDNNKDETFLEKQNPPEKSIVVLPFENISSDPEQEYFSDGLTEEIITDLSHIQDLLVISRNSAMTFKGTNKKVKEIANDVNVQYALEGSVRKSGNNLRISAQLVDASTDTHLWTEKYGGTIDDIFDIQEKVSRSIVSALKIKLTPKEDKSIAENSINNIQAYECYLKARQEMWKFTEEGLDRAKTHIESGMQILGDNELLFIAKGLIYTQYINFGLNKDRRLLDNAEDCVLKALDLNPESSMGYYLLGFIDVWKPDMKNAANNMKISLKHNPNNSDTLNMLAYWYALSGKSSQAEPLFRRAFKFDPINPLIYGFYSVAKMYEGDIETALQYINKSLQINSDNPLMRITHAFLLAYSGQLDDVYIIIDQMINDFPKSPYTQLGLFFKYAIQGNKTEALNSATKELKLAMRDNNYYPMRIAECYALIGEKDIAIDWVENATQWDLRHFHYLNEHTPFLDSIRDEPGYKKLMKKVKKEWEAFDI
ncbi:hypothetical protein ACFLTI_06910 [Bacteroidota bacterium]